jgi:hypothetical protein
MLDRPRRPVHPADPPGGIPHRPATRSAPAPGSRHAAKPKQGTPSARTCSIPTRPATVIYGPCCTITPTRAVPPSLQDHRGCSVVEALGLDGGLVVHVSGPGRPRSVYRGRRRRGRLDGVCFLAGHERAAPGPVGLGAGGLGSRCRPTAPPSLRRRRRPARRPTCAGAPWSGGEAPLANWGRDLADGGGDGGVVHAGPHGESLVWQGQSQPGQGDQHPVTQGQCLRVPGAGEAAAFSPAPAAPQPPFWGWVKRFGQFGDQPVQELRETPVKKERDRAARAFLIVTTSRPCGPASC